MLAALALAALLDLIKHPRAPAERITLKLAKRNGHILNVQPEYEDCKAAASKHGVPIKRVRDAAVVAFYSNT